MSILLQDIDNAENSVKSVRVKLAAIGREIYKMRNGTELGPHYQFEGYERFNFSGPEYMGQHGPDWGLGKPVIAMSYFWSYQGGGETEVVTMPQGWLDKDWRALEQERLDVERAAAAEKARLAQEEFAKANEASERATFERLKAKYEAQP